MGSIVMYICDDCGFESSDLPVGVGMMGVTYAVISCDTCQTIQSRAVHHRMLAGRRRWTGNKGWKPGDPCRQCGGQAERLEEPAHPTSRDTQWRCPECQHHTLRRVWRGNWD